MSQPPALSYLLLLLLAWMALALVAAAIFKLGLEQSSVWKWAPMGVSAVILAGGFVRIAKRLQFRLWEAGFAAVITAGVFVFVAFWILLLVTCFVGGDCI